MDKSLITPEKLMRMTYLQLRAACKELNIKKASTMNKQELFDALKKEIFGDNMPLPSVEKTAKVDKTPEKAVEKISDKTPETRTALSVENRDRDIPYRRYNRDSNDRDNNYNGDYRQRRFNTDGAQRSDGYQRTYPPKQNYQQRYANTNPNTNATAYGNGYDYESLKDAEIRSGILEINPEGFGFLRARNFRNSERDTYVSGQKIKRYGLRAGDLVEGYCKQITELRPPALIELISVNGKDPATCNKRDLFENFVPVYPNEKLKLELTGKRSDLAVRAIDLIAPIGKGQRAMIVSPPKAGKTTLLKMIANSISANNPECKLLVLLIDERPEEVTDMQRSINGEVIYSTFDEESDNHIKVAELVLARAKRLVEKGQDVVILLDSLTRMARANNVIVPSSGKTLSGGVDPVALYFPKRFFGAARNIENGASLTIIATALVDTGSRMDDIVYEEFKGTGNMEIHLDRRLSEKRIFPAIDLLKSGTRKEELLLTQKELEGEYYLRRLLSSGDPQEAAENIITMMTRTANNDEFINQLAEKVEKDKKGGWRN